jgi:hypothetical protein
MENQVATSEHQASPVESPETAHPRRVGLVAWCGNPVGLVQPTGEAGTLGIGAQTSPSRL